MMDELISDDFWFELPIWILIHKDDVTVARDGQEAFRFPARIEVSSVKDPPGTEPFLMAFTDEDLALRCLQSIAKSDFRTLAIHKHQDFLMLLKEVLKVGVPHIGFDTGRRARLIEIRRFLAEEDR